MVMRFIGSAALSGTGNPSVEYVSISKKYILRGNCPKYDLSISFLYVDHKKSCSQGIF
jgi:hypothetical protein